MLVCGYMLKTLKLIILILNISYYLGNGWFIICDLSQRAILSYRESYPSNLNLNMEFFNVVNEMDTFNTLERTVILQYFSFTSLSTVGFGDLTPRSDVERILCAIILLFGVAIFSFMMGIFIDILDEFKSMNQDIAGEAGEKLALFLNLF